MIFTLQRSWQRWKSFVFSRTYHYTSKWLNKLKGSAQMTSSNNGDSTNQDNDTPSTPLGTAATSSSSTPTRSNPEVIDPDHYRGSGRSSLGPLKVESVDVIEAFFRRDSHLAQAFKYMARAGKKPDNSYVQDLEKARWWLTRAIEQASS